MQTFTCSSGCVLGRLCKYGLMWVDDRCWLRRVCVCARARVCVKYSQVVETIHPYVRASPHSGVDALGIVCCHANASDARYRQWHGTLDISYTNSHQSAPTVSEPTAPTYTERTR